MDRPVFYYDYSSVYAYLAACRLGDILPVEPEWHPIWLPPVFAASGRESWVFTDRRDQGLAEVAQRAESYGVPYRESRDLIDKLSVRGSLLAQRGGAAAKREGVLVPYSREIFRRFFAEGEDITVPETIAAAADSAGLDGDAIVAACEDPSVKEEVKTLTQQAIDRGVFGVPTVAVGDELFWGDDKLEEAATALR